MAEVLILGAGVMGSAFSFPLADAGHTVTLVGTHLDRDWISSVRETGVHPKLKMKLPESVVPLTHDQLREVAFRKIDLIVMGVNSAGVDWAVQQLGPLLQMPTPIIMLTKGLRACNNTLQILPDVVREGLAGHGIHSAPVGAIGGPCIAGELAARRHTSVVIAYSDASLLKRILPLVVTPYYHARPSEDIIGVEACAALKNFYALAVGYPAGFSERLGKASNNSFMHNFAAAFFTQALAEMELLVRFVGGAPASVNGLAGAGDLYVTCQAGRNSRMGYLLGTGLRYSEAKANYMAGDTIEGAELALGVGPTIESLIQQGSLSRTTLPLAAAIIDTICHDLPLHIPWEAFH
jgi:glycerol-3-phosphate dehydrogenase (NAD(P)+)